MEKIQESLGNCQSEQLEETVGHDVKIGPHGPELIWHFGT